MRPSDHVGVVPASIAAAPEARDLLHRDGAVLLTGLEPTSDALVVAAALVHGSRLRQVFPARERRTRDGDPVHLHADSFDVVVDTAGVPTRHRDPDEDSVLVQCVRPPGERGESFVADAYRFIDDRADSDPELWDFLTGTDVDLYGAWNGIRGLPATPRQGLCHQQARLAV